MYVSLSKNEGESFAVSFSLCFLLRESHPDCDFEGGWRERSLLSHFPSNNVHSTSHSKDVERRLQAGACSIFRLQRYNIVIAVHEFFDNFFLVFFTTEGKGVKTVNRNLETTTFCCSVAVLKKPFPYAKNSSIYIDIKFISYFHTTIF